MEDDSAAAMISFLVLLLVDVFFYGFGAAVQALNTGEVEKRALEHKDKKSVRLAALLNNPTGYVNTLQLAVSVINIIMGGVYYEVCRQNIRRGLASFVSHNLKGIVYFNALALTVTASVLTVIVLLYIMLTFGILLPKKLAARFPEKWAYLCINPVYYMTKILLPFTGLVTVSVNGILHMFGMGKDTDMADVTEEEIISMVNEGHEQGVIQASEAEMITNIFELGDKEAQDIMTHRNQITAIDGEITLREAIAFMLNEKYSRYPVYEENIDNIIGILHLKDAMRMQAGRKQNKPVKEIQGLLREAEVVPQTKNIDDLFKTMQSMKLQMVIVIDEYGQTTGLVAMEDILEEIVGNIMDEYDEDESHIQEKGNDEYIIEGKTRLEELEERFGISFEEEEFETLNGFLISKMDKIPEEDEQFEIDVSGYNFKILSVENKMIHSVLVTKCV